MKLVIGNHKMNLLSEDIDSYISFFEDKNYSNVFFAPSFIYLNKFVNSGLNTVSQDVSAFENGAYTGDISSMQLKSLSIKYSLVSHSERRKYYNDSKYTNKKIIRLLEQDLIPILCIGEEKEDRSNNSYKEFLCKEIDEAFNNIKKDFLENVIIAYEPIWAIGTGIVPTNIEIHNTINLIKNYVLEKYDVNIKVLYGGSVNSKNIMELEKINVLDGYLVGGASLKKEEFNDLIEKIN